MTFGEALELAKQGKFITRKNWNGKDQFVFYIEKEDLEKCFDSNVASVFDIRPTLAFKSARGQIQVGWLASQTDMLEDDWEEFKIEQEVMEGEQEEC